MSKEYHVYCTQEFPCRYWDELLILFKEPHLYQNTEEGHLAYSFPKKPCIVIDQLALPLEPEILSMYRSYKILS